MARAKNVIHAVELETDRFNLVPIRPLSLVWPTWHWTKDRESFASLGWRTSGWTPRRWWRHLRHQVQRNRMCHGIWLKQGGTCIGLHVASVSVGARSAFVGVIVGERDWWAKGVVAEVRSAILDDCFTRLKLERVGAQVQARNLASVYNHRRLGFTHEGTLRSAGIDRDGSRVDMLMFGMLREEWMARREHRDGDGRL